MSVLVAIWLGTVSRARLWYQFCTPLPRVTDAAFNFLLVWYYCTLTIRESILINNGSRCACAVGRVVLHTGYL